MSTSSKPDTYRLMRSPVASCMCVTCSTCFFVPSIHQRFRLNAQHYLWKRTCGFNLHPSIPLQANEVLRIADIGTGTGIWMDDVKQRLGNLAAIDGYDKSLQQCPPLGLCPQGCTNSQLDISQGIPDYLKHVYDILNVRLIQGGLKGDPVPALKNMMSMLKPGGRLRWQEINLKALSIATVDESINHTATQRLLDEIAHFGFGRWTPRLADICTDTGFLESRTNRYRVPPEICIPFCQTQFLAYEEISRVAMDNEGPDANGPRLRAVLEQAYRELNTGVWLDHELEVTTAMKPS